MPRYNQDPYWLTLRFRGVCARCKRQLRRGERAFRSKDGSLFCDKDECGGQESRDFSAAKMDEEFFSGPQY